MSSSKSVLEDALQLPPSDRATIARELIASLAGPTEDDAGEAWLTEVERREQDLATDPAKFEDWAAVRGRISARLRTIRS